MFQIQNQLRHHLGLVVVVMVTDGVVALFLQLKHEFTETGMQALVDPAPLQSVLHLALDS